MYWIRIILVIMLGLISAQTEAFEQWEPTLSEMVSLPPYCSVRFNSKQGSPQYDFWEKRLGRDFIHTHHYCAGLNFLNRYYLAVTPQDKQYNLDNALNNFSYMVDHASPTYILMPEVYLNRGMVNSLLHNDAQAISDLHTAQKLNPKLTNTYFVLADFYVRIKQEDQALEAVSEGLRYNPDSTSLKQRYDQLGGKKPYPEPYPVVSPNTVVSDKVQTNESMSTGRGSETSSDRMPGRTDSGKQDIANTSPEKNGASTPASSTIGTPSNPYCRFCPPEE